jgi:hypothetical protein
MDKGMNMKYAFLIAGAVTLGIAGPATAKHNYDHGCPPGLAKKHNGCMAPGHAKRFNRGQRWQSGYGTYYTYNRIPYDVRRRYALNSRYRYYYDNGTLYGVDPNTLLVQQVVSALLR